MVIRTVGCSGTETPSSLGRCQSPRRKLLAHHVRQTHGRRMADLQDSINAWIGHWNTDPKPFTWHKTADDILDTPAAHLQRINGSEH